MGSGCRRGGAKWPALVLRRRPLVGRLVPSPAAQMLNLTRRHPKRPSLATAAASAAAAAAAAQAQGRLKHCE